VDAMTSNIGNPVLDEEFKSKYKVILDFYLTLPSGLKGTHSHENM